MSSQSFRPLSINEIYSSVTPVAPSSPTSNSINWQTVLIIAGGVIITAVIVSSIISSANTKIIAQNQKLHEEIQDTADMNHRYTTNILTQLQNNNDALIDASKNHEEKLETVTTDGAKKLLL